MNIERLGYWFFNLFNGHLLKDKNSFQGDCWSVWRLRRQNNLSASKLVRNDLPSGALLLQNHWGLHKESGAFFPTATLKWYELWWHCPRVCVAYPVVPAVGVERASQPPHGSPSLCVPVQTLAALDKRTGHTSLSIRVKRTRSCRYDQMRCSAKSRPWQAFH